jgi:hypothetical protein
MMNRITEIFLDEKSTQQEKELLENNVIHLNENLNVNELDSLRSAIVDKKIQGNLYRSAWKMLLCQLEKNSNFIDACGKRLLAFNKNIKSTVYGDSVDLQLQYFLAKSTNTEYVLEKFSKILIGSLQLVIAEFYFSKNERNLGLHYLIKSISCEDNDIGTMDSIDLWLSDISSPEVRQHLNEKLVLAISENKPKTLIAALEHALSET